jgi:lipopolysaccharide/colanic/teichoic acid biosynthesis glycosyltransferase
VFKRGSKVILRIKTGSGAILRFLFPRRTARAQRVPSARAYEGSNMSLMAANVRGNDSTVRRDVLGPRQPFLAPPSSPFFAVAKTAMDLGFALFLLVATAPMMLAAMVLIKLTSRGPVVYWQTRLGENGKPFIIYKLRTMVHKCENSTGARWSTPGDTRVTPLGRLLRRMHIDELPQLWNVLRGDMSLVGPRPERPEFVPQLEQAIVHYRDRMLMKPGVTGLAQVQLPPDTNLASVRLKLAFDLYYIQHAGVWMDMRILLSTGLKMINVPFAAIRKLFGFPTKETVERAYQQLPKDHKAQPARVQTA